MKELDYPFDGDDVLKRKKAIKKQLLEQDIKFLEKNVAILGGSTTSNIKIMLELFLLNQGIKPNFYESEYNQYWQDATFGNKELDEFNPDIIYIHTTNYNIINYPAIYNTKEEINELLEQEYQRFVDMWNKLFTKFNCPIIQNNFEYPFYRLLGNKDATDIHGKVNYITRLNLKFAEYAEEHENFLINDINYISASFGLDAWADRFFFHMYKYALSVKAIPLLAFNVSNIIKAIYGKNKKGFVLDLDNTLWGGIIGDDGVDNISIGQETSLGQVYSEFQNYIKEHKQIGIILNINSKNEEVNAIAGLDHVDGTLKKEDFIVIKANWSPKSNNMNEIAEELNLGVDSLVFVDDNPAERAIVNQFVPTVSTPAIDCPENYIKILDKSGFFEVINISDDDIKKNEMYRENAERNKQIKSFDNYDDYLKSLEMHAVVDKFIPLYLSRIAQLTNKSNQFNLTTKRYTQAEIEDVNKNDNYITLYGKLEDIFGDNGVVSVVIGSIKENILDIDLWIMSCRVLKRDMEFAMMDTLVKKSKENGINKIYGYYYPTSKNAMVKDFYEFQGFTKIEEDVAGNTKWEFIIDDNYQEKNKFIKVESNDE